MREVLWWRAHLTEVWQANLEPTTIHEDNQGAIALAQNPVRYGANKHIELRRHWVRQQIKENKVKVSYLPTDQMVADTLTKPLARIKFLACTKVLMGEDVDKVEGQLGKPYPSNTMGDGPGDHTSPPVKHGQSEENPETSYNESLVFQAHREPS
jgi:hypothetical protein